MEDNGQGDPQVTTPREDHSFCGQRQVHGVSSVFEDEWWSGYVACDPLCLLLQVLKNKHILCIPLFFSGTKPRAWIVVAYPGGKGSCIMHSVIVRRH
jgi:hypothetical protein